MLANTPEQKIQLFTQAVRLEPKYSQAQFQLGRLHWQEKELPRRGRESGKVAAH